MEEYVAKSVLKKELNISNLHAGIIDALQNIVDEIPAADVQEVKHAHWEFLYETGRRHCSACKTEALCDRGSYSEHLSKCCPECGAKMDEEDGK